MDAMQGQSVALIQQQQEALRKKAGIMGRQGKRRAEDAAGAVGASANAEVYNAHWACLNALPILLTKFFLLTQFFALPILPRLLPAKADMATWAPGTSHCSCVQPCWLWECWCKAHHRTRLPISAAADS